MKADKQLLLSKIEATYGVDPIPTGAADSAVVGNIKVSPLEMTSNDRVALKGFQGSSGKIISGTHVKFGWEVEAFASGILGTPPAYGMYMKGCAHSETIAAGVSVTHVPIDSAEQSLTHYFNRDGKLRKISGWRGSCGLKMNSKGIPVWSFDGVGLYTTPTDTPMAVPTLTAWKEPLAVEAGITTATLHGYAGNISDFSFTQGAGVAYRNLINGESVIFNGRKATGSITMEEPTMAQKDFETIINNGTKAAFSLTHGAVAGNRIKFTAANTQIISYAESKVDGIAMIQLGLEFVPLVAGGDYSVVFD